MKESLVSCAVTTAIDAEAVAGVIVSIAKSWEREGVLDRAEGTYRLALETLGEQWWRSLYTAESVKGLARIEAAKGIRDCARQLADAHTSMVRAWYREGRWGLDGVLAALEFQEHILSSIGDRAAAFLVKRKIEELTKQR